MPTVLLAEHIKHLRLVAHGAQLRRVLRIGQAYEQTIAIRDEVEKVYLRGAHKERPVEVVCHIAQCIIVRIKFTTTFEQLCLVFKSRTTEKFHRIFGVRRQAVERQVVVNNFLHTRLELLYLRRRNATWKVQMAVIAITHRILNAQHGVGEKVVRRLVKHKEDGARISAMPRGRSNVKVFYILVVEEHKVKPLHLIINLRTRSAVRHLQFQKFIHLFKVKTHRHLVRASSIYTTNIYSLSHSS